MEGVTKYQDKLPKETQDHFEKFSKAKPNSCPQMAKNIREG